MVCLEGHKDRVGAGMGIRMAGYVCMGEDCGECSYNKDLSKEGRRGISNKVGVRMEMGTVLERATILRFVRDSRSTRKLRSWGRDGEGVG